MKWLTKCLKQRARMLQSSISNEMKYFFCYKNRSKAIIYYYAHTNRMEKFGSIRLFELQLFPQIIAIVFLKSCIEIHCARAFNDFYFVFIFAAFTVGSVLPCYFKYQTTIISSNKQNKRIFPNCYYLFQRLNFASLSIFFFFQ